MPNKPFRGWEYFTIRIVGVLVIVAIALTVVLQLLTANRVSEARQSARISQLASELASRNSQDIAALVRQQDKQEYVDCLRENDTRKESNKRVRDLHKFMIAASVARASQAEQTKDPHVKAENLRAARIYRRLASDFRPSPFRTCRAPRDKLKEGR